MIGMAAAWTDKTKYDAIALIPEKDMKPSLVAALGAHPELLHSRILPILLGYLFFCAVMMAKLKYRQWQTACTKPASASQARCCSMVAG